MRVVLFLFLMLIVAACTPQDTKLAAGDGAGAVMEGDDILLFGADHGGKGIDGKSFSCEEGTAQCRRVFVARYDKKFKRTALYSRDYPAQQVMPALYPRTAGGYYLVALAGAWMTSETGTSHPVFDVVVTELSSALEAVREFEILSDDTQEIHAAFLTDAGTLTVAGMSGGMLFVDRYDAATGEKIGGNAYSDEMDGIVVFLAGSDAELHLVRWFSETGFRYLVVDEEGTITDALTITGDAMAPDPSVGTHGIAASLLNGTLYWFGEDDGLYRFVRGATVTIETAAMLDAGDLTYQRDIRFIGANLYVFGANDRVQHFEACAYGGDATTVNTHETELVLVKYDASYVQLWSDRDTEDATYRALEILTRGKERFFLFQKGEAIYLRPTE